MLDIGDIWLVNGSLLQAFYAGIVAMLAEVTRTAVKRLLLCGYNIVGNNNGLASVEDIAVLFAESHDGQTKIVLLNKHHYSSVKVTLLCN